MARGRYVVPRQRQFRADLAVVNDCLDELIGLARQCSEPEDLEALQARDYSKVASPTASLPYRTTTDVCFVGVCQRPSVDPGLPMRTESLSSQYQVIIRSNE